MSSLILSLVIIANTDGFEIDKNAEIASKRYNRKGLILLRRGSYREAEKNFRRAIRANPGVKYYYNNLSVSLMKQKRYRAARKYLTLCISMDKNYVKALSNMAVVSFYLLRFREAYLYYNLAKSLNPSYIKKRFRKRKVEKSIRDMLRENPGNRDLFNILRYMEQ